MRERERWYLLAREEGDISLVGPDKRGRRRTLQSPQHEARCSFRVFQRPSRRPSARGRLERSPGERIERCSRDRAAVRLSRCCPAFRPRPPAVLRSYSSGGQIRREHSLSSLASLSDLGASGKSGEVSTPSGVPTSARTSFTFMLELMNCNAEPSSSRRSRLATSSLPSTLGRSQRTSRTSLCAKPPNLSSSRTTLRSRSSASRRRKVFSPRGGEQAGARSSPSQRCRSSSLRRSQPGPTAATSSPTSSSSPRTALRRRSCLTTIDEVLAAGETRGRSGQGPRDVDQVRPHRHARDVGAPGGGRHGDGGGV